MSDEHLADMWADLRARKDARLAARREAAAWGEYRRVAVYLLLIGLPLNLQGTSWWNGVKGRYFNRKSA